MERENSKSCHKVGKIYDHDRMHKSFQPHPFLFDVQAASSHTIQRELWQKGFIREHVKKTPQIPSAAAMKRVASVKEQLPKGSQFWSRVIFSDEKKWNLKGCQYLERENK